MPIIRRKNGDYAPSEYTMSAAKDDPTTLKVTIEEKAIRGKPMFAPLHVAGLVVSFDACLVGAIGEIGQPVVVEHPKVMERAGENGGGLWLGQRQRDPALAPSEKWKVYQIMGGSIILVRTAKQP